MKKNIDDIPPKYVEWLEIMTGDVTMNKEKEFLKEYKELCIKYGMVIDSCGCCGSTWIEAGKSPDQIEIHIEHLENS